MSGADHPNERDETGGSRPAQAPPAPQAIVRTGLLFYGAMGIAALFWRMSTPGDSILHPSVAAAAEAWSLPAAIAAGVAAGLVSIAASEGLTRWTKLGDALANLLAESLGPLDRANAWLLALASGVAEELFFRGALQAEVGIVWASLIFGAAHFLPRRELALWSVYAVAMGFGLGALYDWTGQLAAPIAAHVLVNGINLPRLVARSAARSAAASAAERDRVDLDPRA